MLPDEHSLDRADEPAAQRQALNKLRGVEGGPAILLIDAKDFDRQAISAKPLTVLQADIWTAFQQAVTEQLTPAKPGEGIIAQVSLQR